MDMYGVMVNSRLRYLTRTRQKKRTLFIGERNAYEILAQELDGLHAKDYEMAGIAICENSIMAPGGIPVISASTLDDSLEQIIEELNIDLVVVSSSNSLSGNVLDRIAKLKNKGAIELYNMPDFFSNLTLASSSSDSFMPSFPISSNLECASMIELI